MQGWRMKIDKLGMRVGERCKSIKVETQGVGGDGEG